jgi:uridine kinase
MMEHVRSIAVRIAGQTHEVPYGTAVGKVLARFAPPSPVALAAIAHHRCVDLTFPLTAATEVLPVSYGMREGVLVYRRTASLLLIEAVRRLFGPVPVRIGQGLANGYFYEVDLNDDELDETHVERIAQQMRQLVAQDIPLRTELVVSAEAKRIFAAQGQTSKVQLLKNWWETHVTLVFCGEVCDIHHYPVAPRAGYIKHFELLLRSGQLLLRFPTRQRPDAIEPIEGTNKLRAVYNETRGVLRRLGVGTVGQLNMLTLNGEAGELIRIAEGLHEKKIAQIADQICDGQSAVRVVLIAGPSSSGKTTFSKRLSLQLRVNGVTPVALSTDSFYVDRVDTPLDDEGHYDFESIDAIDLPLFNQTLTKLLAGEQVLTPRYDFPRGRRKPRDDWRPLQLLPGQVLLIEGIHGLNPRLTERLPDTVKFRIYINALTQLCIDEHNRIFTSDTRLLRRIVRDRLFRGYSAQETIANWPRVRRGEMRWIYPFQEAADVMFNSSLVYEHAVLRLYAERFLLEVPEDDEAFVNAHRLLRFVEYFVPMFDESTPETSIIREFVGGSFFNY